jgi:hypothetical protein
MKKKSDVKKKVIYVIIIIILVVVGGKFAPQIRTYFTYIHPAKTRVKLMLSNIQGPMPKEYGAISQWAKGVPMLKQEEADKYSMAFDEFRREKDIFPKVKSFTIDKVVLVDDGFLKPYVRVSCTIDGKKLKMIVRKDEPIAWAPR